jgi:hypothetical protein
MEVMWVQTVLHELQILWPKSARQWCMKHVEIDYHFIRVAQKLLEVRFISMDDQLAYGFTKPLPHGRLLQFQRNLNLIKL